MKLYLGKLPVLASSLTNPSNSNGVYPGKLDSDNNFYLSGPEEYGGNGQDDYQVLDM